MDIVLIDDEQESIDLLEKKILELDIYQLIIAGKFTNLDAAENFIKNNKVDLIFLDIIFQNESENINEAGFLFLDRFKNSDIKFNVVFVSGNGTDENKARAVNLAGFGLIVKPIVTSYVANAIIKILYRMLDEKEKFIENTSAIFENALLNSKNQNQLENKISITIRKTPEGQILEGNQTIFIKINDILYFESINKKINIVTIDEKYCTSVGTLISYKKKLELYDFVENGKSFLVNSNNVKKYDKDSIYFSDGKVIINTNTNFTIK